MACCCPNAGAPPEEWEGIVGNWTGEGTTLNIGGSGSLNYEHKDGNSSASVSGNVSKWESDSFKTTMCMCCGKNFEVSEKPHQDDDGNWKMTVNGIDMTR